MKIDQNTKIEIAGSYLMVSTINEAGHPIVHLSQLEETSPGDYTGYDWMLTINAGDVGDLREAIRTLSNHSIRGEDGEVTLTCYLESQESLSHATSYTFEFSNDGLPPQKLRFNTGRYEFDILRQVLDHNLELVEAARTTPAP